MNLWNIFSLPLFDALLEFNQILLLPLVAAMFYAYVFYALIKHAQQRTNLALFLLLTVLASGSMFLGMGPNIGKIMPPILLFMVILMPLFMIILNVLKKHYLAARIWTIVTLAGLMHSLSWSLLLFMMMNS